MNNTIFAPRAWKEYLEWQNEDKKTLKRINLLIKDIQRSPFDGLGKPEPLKGDLSGSWSREIDEKNRMIYRILYNGDVDIIQCKGHYDDK